MQKAKEELQWRDENNNPIWKDTYIYAILNIKE